MAIVILGGLVTSTLLNLSSCRPCTCASGGAEASRRPREYGEQTNFQRRLHPPLRQAYSKRKLNA
jgi:hypothetical protein